MTTGERTTDYQNSQLMGSGSMDFGKNRVYGLLQGEATTGVELEAEVGSHSGGGAVVYFKKDAADTSAYEDGLYMLGADGMPEPILGSTLLLLGAIADATGDDLSKIANVEQVKAYINERETKVFLGLGTIDTDVTDLPTSLLPSDMLVDRSYYGRIKSGVTVNGQTYERGGLFYATKKSDETVTWDFLEMNDDVVVAQTVTASTDAVSGQAVIDYVGTVTTPISTLVNSNKTRLDTLENTTIPAINNQLGTIESNIDDVEADIVAIDGEITSVKAKDVAQDSAIQALQTKDGEQDGRLDAVELKNTAQDTSIADLVSKDATQAAEITALQEKDNSQDTEITNIKLKDDAQDTSIQAIQAKDTTQDGRLDAVELKNSQQDTSIADLISKDSTQAAQITALGEKDTAQDTAIAAIETKNTAQDTAIGERLVGTSGDFAGDVSSKGGQFADIPTVEARILALLPDGSAQVAFPLSVVSGSASVSTASISAALSTPFYATAALYHKTKKRYFSHANLKFESGITASFGGVYQSIADGTVELHIIGHPK